MVASNDTATASRAAVAENIPAVDASVKACESACSDCADITSLGSDCYSVMFTPAVIEDPSRAMKLLSMIREFCDGGSQVRINCVNSACLRKA